MRHLGFLRKKFWRQLDGTVTPSFKSTQFKTTCDLTLELEPGEKVYI